MSHLLKEILAARADKLGSKSQRVRLLQKLVRAQYIHLEAAAQRLTERIAQFVANPCLGAERQNRDFPFVAVGSVEAKVAVLMMRKGTTGTRKKRFARSRAIHAHDVRILSFVES
jgi:hypothetical protein